MTEQAPSESTHVDSLSRRLRAVAEVLNREFLDKQKAVRLLLVSVIAGEHMILVGPPGTAKSALITRFSELIDAQYFEYLLTRFTEPNELFGPVDIGEFRNGKYVRRTEGMLPEAEIVFLDEIFKSNSAILNSLLHVINERKYTSGGVTKKVPLLSVFAASNEVPSDDDLSALLDRFLLRVFSGNLDSYHFRELLSHGMVAEQRKMIGEKTPCLLTSDDIRGVQKLLATEISFSETFLASYKSLLFQIRSEGISVSDRRAVKFLKLFGASAILDGRLQPNNSDLFVLKNIWNNMDQISLLDEMVTPVLDAYYLENPMSSSASLLAGPRVSLDSLLSELATIRGILHSASELSDIQLFAQLKNVNEIRNALLLHDSDTAKDMVNQVDSLLETVFASSKFGV